MPLVISEDEVCDFFHELLIRHPSRMTPGTCDEIVAHELGSVDCDHCSGRPVRPWQQPKKLSDHGPDRLRVMWNDVRHGGVEAPLGRRLDWSMSAINPNTHLENRCELIGSQGCMHSTKSKATLSCWWSEC